MKYRLLAGMHIEGNPNQTDPCKPGHDVVFRAGDIIDTKSDLLKFNCPGMPPKFERLHDHQTNPGFTWDPSRETFEEFAKRVQAVPLPASRDPATVAEAAEAGFSGKKPQLQPAGKK